MAQQTNRELLGLILDNIQEMKLSVDKLTTQVNEHSIKLAIIEQKLIEKDKFDWKPIAKYIGIALAAFLASQGIDLGLASGV